MKVRNTIPLQHFSLIDYLGDDDMLLRLITGPQLTLSMIDSDDLTVMGNFSIQTTPHEFYHSAADNSCVYIPTKEGQILAIDKFSGEILATANMAMPIMSDVEQDKQNIYCICGVPISTKWRLNVDNYCLCISDKETGQKKAQTNYFDSPCSMTLSNDDIWVSSSSLKRYLKTGEFVNEIKIPKLAYKPIVTDNYVISCFHDGLVRVFNCNDLELYSIINAEPNISGPLITATEEIVWITDSGICRVNFHEKVFLSIAANKNMAPVLALSPDRTLLFGCSTDGCLVTFDLYANTSSFIKLSKEQLQKPEVVGNYVFVLNKENLIQIEISS